MMTQAQENSVTENLRDAQCSPAFIQDFLALWNTGRKEEAFCLLSRHRGCLLCKIHEMQKPLDHLDYLIHKLKKKE